METRRVLLAAIPDSLKQFEVSVIDLLYQKSNIYLKPHPDQKGL